MFQKRNKLHDSNKNYFSKLKISDDDSNSETESKKPVINFKPNNKQSDKVSGNQSIVLKPFKSAKTKKSVKQPTDKHLVVQEPDKKMAVQEPVKYFVVLESDIQLAVQEPIIEQTLIDDLPKKPMTDMESDQKTEEPIFEVLLFPQEANKFFLNKTQKRRVVTNLSLLPVTPATKEIYSHLEFMFRKGQCDHVALLECLNTKTFELLNSICDRNETKKIMEAALKFEIKQLKSSDDRTILNTIMKIGYEDVDIRILDPYIKNLNPLASAFLKFVNKEQMDSKSFNIAMHGHLLETFKDLTLFGSQTFDKANAKDWDITGTITCLAGVKKTLEKFFKLNLLNEEKKNQKDYSDSDSDNSAFHKNDIRNNRVEKYSVHYFASMVGLIDFVPSNCRESMAPAPAREMSIDVSYNKIVFRNWDKLGFNSDISITDALENIRKKQLTVAPFPIKSKEDIKQMITCWIRITKRLNCGWTLGANSPSIVGNEWFAPCSKEMCSNILLTSTPLCENVVRIIVEFLNLYDENIPCWFQTTLCRYAKGIRANDKKQNVPYRMILLSNDKTASTQFCHCECMLKAIKSPKDSGVPFNLYYSK